MLVGVVSRRGGAVPDRLTSSLHSYSVHRQLVATPHATYERGASSASPVGVKALKPLPLLSAGKSITEGTAGLASDARVCQYRTGSATS